MTPREERGLVIAALCKLKQNNGMWRVPSQSVSAKLYIVDLNSQKCDCPDCAQSGFKCKHIFAVEFTIKREQGSDGTVTETREMSITTKRPTYPQVWPAYHKAQVEEKQHFRVFLHDLCQGISQPPRKGVGRLPTLASDAVFACAFKVYSTISTRRFSTDLKEACEKGFISKAIHYNSICSYLENHNFTEIIKDLIVRSSLPLKSVESQFAPDSTGFSTSRFIRWFDEKYGVTRSGHDWVKMHMMCGVKTNIVTAVEIEGRHAADAPLFGPLVKTTAANFKIAEISADKGYLSEENIEETFRHGAIPFIPPKSNTTDAKGGLWAKMFHYYQLNQEEFYQHYHRRSNAESTFSMMKAKFGDHIRSRTDVAMRNEALCKVLCHNICCLIQSMFELNIEPAFWKSAAESV